MLALLRRPLAALVLLLAVIRARFELVRAHGLQAGDAILDSVIRTTIPLLVGLLISGLIAIGWHPSDTDQANLAAQVSAVLTVVITALYYAIVRILETHVSPKFGWLLGLAKQPDYGTTPVTVPGVIVPPAGGAADGGQDDEGGA